jgi:predicted NAD/FAD-binding protein
MTAAIWSANPQELHRFPFTFLANFFENHKMLEVNNRPIWQVVKGGSHSYLKAFKKKFKGKIKLSSPVNSILREKDAIKIKTEKDDELFDEVIIAAHSDQALKLLATPTILEKEILSSFSWQKNIVMLHTDHKIMPTNKRAWASWNYFLSSKQQSQACVTYYMNRLQSLKSKKEYFVSLNAEEYLDSKKIIKSITYYHPVFGEQAFQNQSRHSEISGSNRIHFCGAYWGYGFHEDGVKSALKVCQRWGVNL